MLKREITFDDLEGTSRTETFYFNISKPQLVELMVDAEDGDFGTWLQSIIDTKDYKELVAQFKRIILLAYGEKDKDGIHFIQNEEVREKFSYHPAFGVLFMEFATDADAAATFLKGVLPPDLVGEIDKAMAEGATVSTLPAVSPGDTPAAPPTS